MNLYTLLINDTCAYNILFFIADVILMKIKLILVIKYCNVSSSKLISIFNLYRHDVSKVYFCNLCCWGFLKLGLQLNCFYGLFSVSISYLLFYCYISC